jgi:hypothetical protein
LQKEKDVSNTLQGITIGELIRAFGAVEGTAAWTVLNDLGGVRNNHIVSDSAALAALTDQKFRLGPYGALQVMGIMRIAGLAYSSIEAARLFAAEFVRRAAQDIDGARSRVSTQERAKIVCERARTFSSLLRIHVGCLDALKIKTVEDALTAFELWHHTDVRVAPCHALRFVFALRDCAPDSFDAALRLAREHGAERLDDLARLVLDGRIDAAAARELDANPELVRSLTHAQLDFLLRTFAASDKTNLLALARRIRTDLRGLRTAAKPTAPADGAITYQGAAAALAWARTPEPGQTPENPSLARHAAACPTQHRDGTGRYVPAADRVLGNEPTKPFIDGIARRFLLTGEALLDVADRVQRIFGDHPDEGRVLLVLDLYANWTGSVPPDICLRASVAACEARIPDPNAFDFLARLGASRVAEGTALIEEKLIGLKECQRFARYPDTLERHKTDLRTFLTSYHGAGSPKRMERLDGEAAKNHAPLRRPHGRTNPFKDTTVADRKLYEKALLTAESKKPEQAAPPADVASVRNARTAPPAANPNPLPAIRTPEADDVITKAMGHIGATTDEAADAVAAWNILVQLIRMESSEAYILVAEALARFLKAEAAERRHLSRPKIDLFRTVFMGLFISGTRVRESFVEMLLNAQVVGIRIPTRTRFERFHKECCARVGQHPDKPFEGQPKQLLEGILGEIERHRGCFGEWPRVRSSETALLLAIDLFADGAGKWTMCRCLRLGGLFDWFDVDHEKARSVAAAFRERPDDLIALCENKNIGAKNAARLSNDPALVANNDLASLTKRLNG